VEAAFAAVQKSKLVAIRRFCDLSRFFNDATPRSFGEFRSHVCHRPPASGFQEGSRGDLRGGVGGHMEEGCC
jgi:hypothetical protein